MACVNDATFCSMWQIHGLSSVLGVQVKSIYPKMNGQMVGEDLNRVVLPRRKRMGKQVSL